jgi:hypothetical protein
MLAAWSRRSRISRRCIFSVASSIGVSMRIPFATTNALSRLEVERKDEQSYGSFAPIQIIFGSGLAVG